MSTNSMVVRLLSAVLVVAGGVLHFQLWDDRYRTVPDGVPGSWVVRQGFPLNAALSVLIAVALVLSVSGLITVAPRLVGFAALALEAGSVAALLLSRTDEGIFGWMERGTQWPDGSLRILFVELAALVVLMVDQILVGAAKAAGHRR